MVLSMTCSSKIREVASIQVPIDAQNDFFPAVLFVYFLPLPFYSFRRSEEEVLPQAMVVIDLSASSCLPDVLLGKSTAIICMGWECPLLR